MNKSIPIGHPSLIRPGLLFRVEVDLLSAEVPHSISSSLQGYPLFVPNVTWSPDNYGYLRQNDIFCTLQLKKRVYYQGTREGSVQASIAAHDEAGNKIIWIRNNAFANTDTYTWEILHGEKILAVRPNSIAYLCRNIG